MYKAQNSHQFQSLHDYAGCKAHKTTYSAIHNDTVALHSFFTLCLILGNRCFDCLHCQVQFDSFSVRMFTKCLIFVFPFVDEGQTKTPRGPPLQHSSPRWLNHSGARPIRHFSGIRKGDEFQACFPRWNRCMTSLVAWNNGNGLASTGLLASPSPSRDSVGLMPCRVDGQRTSSLRQYQIVSNVFAGRAVRRWR